MMGLYVLGMFLFAVLMAYLIKKPYEALKGPEKTGYVVKVMTDKGVIMGVELEHDGVVVCRQEHIFRDEKEATTAILTKYYKQLEAEYIARTRRVNYAMGDRQTVTRIKRMFAHTLKGRELLELMEEVNENVNSAKDN